MDDHQPYINTVFFKRCLLTLEKAHSLLLVANSESIDYDLYRSACIKEFEIMLEQAGKLLKRALKLYVATPKSVDKLTFKDIFRHSAKHGLLSKEQVQRWLLYRDNRNITAHDYGKEFAEHTLKLLAEFITDASALEKVLQGIQHD